MKSPFYTFFTIFLFITVVTSSLSQTPTKKIQLNIKSIDSTQKPKTFLFDNYKELSSHLSNSVNQLQEQGFLTAYHTNPEKINDST